MSELRVRRELAGISQEQLGLLIGITQDQVRRYEADLEAVPHGIYDRWMAACGGGLAPALAPEFNFGQPYAELGARLGLLEQFLESAPPHPAHVPDVLVTAEGLRERVRAARERPVVVFAGKFDSGKTRMVNALIGGERLPCSYQPTTAISTFLRHAELKPVWQRDEVWIVRRGFDPSRWFDQRHCEEFRLAAGGVELLERYGTVARPAPVREPGAVAALVYVDAPVLCACSMVDLPGFDDSQAQADMAQAALRLGDVVIYASMAKGFLGLQDRIQIAQLLRRTSHLISGDPLANLLVVATHADPSISNDQLAEILDRGGQSLFRHIKDGVFKEFVAGTARHGGSVTASDVRDRIFTFWAESPARRGQFEQELARLLGQILPALVIQRVEREIAGARDAGTEAVRRQIEGCERLLQDQETAREQIGRLRRAEPARRARVEEFTRMLQRHVEQLRAKTAAFITTRVEPGLQVAAIEEFIQTHFDGRKEAQEGAAGKLLEDIQAGLETHLVADGDQLKIHIQRFLDDYSHVSLDGITGPGAIKIPFDVRGAFLGGLTGAGTLGALGLWAATVGSLSGYVLVPKGVSDLAALGISINAAAAMGIVAAIGGPVTIAVGVAAVAFGMIKTLFGETWQRRLAKQISASLAESEFLVKLQRAADLYWDDTVSAIQCGIDSLETGYDAYLTKLEALATEQAGSAGAQARMEETIQHLQRLQDFFVHIPWRSSS